MRPALVGRFDDPFSVRLDGAVDEDNVARRVILRKEETRKRVVERILAGGTIDEMFKKLDTDGSGDISAEELVSGLKNLGLSLLISDAADILKDMDSDNNGTIDLDEFKAFLEMDLSNEKLKRFDAKLEAERRQKMVAHFNTTSLSSTSNLKEATPVAKWQERAKAVPSAYDNYSNGKAVTACRRTSFAMGYEANHDRIQTELALRSLDNRNKLRKTLKEKIEREGFNTFWTQCQPDATGEISFRRLKRVLDRWGLSVVHQDSGELMNSIDTNGNGVISEEELKTFLHADPLSADEFAKQKRVNDQVQIGKGKISVNQIPKASFMQPTASTGHRLRMINPKLAPLPSASGWRSPLPPAPKPKRKYPPQHSGKTHHQMAPYNYPTRRMVTERKKAQRERVTQAWRLSQLKMQRNKNKSLMSSFGWRKKVMPISVRTI